MNTKNNQNPIRPLLAVCTFLSLIFSFNTLFAQLDNADLVLGRTEENFLSKTTATFDLVVGVKECVTSAISYDEMNGKKVITGYFPEDRLIFNKEGKLINKERFTRKYDKNLKKVITSQKPHSRELFRYNDKGLITSATRFYFGDEEKPDTDIVTVEVYYNDNNQIELTKNLINGLLLRTEQFIYNTDGKIAVKNIILNRAEIRSDYRMVYQYNSEGLLSQKIEIRDRVILEKHTYEYNAQGLVSHEIKEIGTHLIEGNQVYEGADIYEYFNTYDSNGNLSLVEQYEYTSRNQKNKKKNTISYHTKYGSNKQILSEERNNSANDYKKLFEYEYDSKGSIIKETTYEIDKATNHKILLGVTTNKITYY